jgi:hypothetical protein
MGRRFRALLKHPRSHGLAFFGVEPAALIGIKLLSHFRSPLEVPLASTRHLPMGFVAFRFTQFAVPIGVKSGHHLRWVCGSLAAITLRMHSAAKIVPLVGRQEVHKVPEVLGGGAATLRDEIGLLLHQLGQRLAIG